MLLKKTQSPFIMRQLSIQFIFIGKKSFEFSFEVRLHQIRGDENVMTAICNIWDCQTKKLNNVEILYVGEGWVIHTNMPATAHHHAMPYINYSTIPPLHIISSPWYFIPSLCYFHQSFKMCSFNSNTDGPIWLPLT